MPTSHKRTHSFWRNIGWILLIVALLLLPTMKWGGLLQASESKASAAASPWKAASKPRTPQYIGRGSQHKIQVSDQTVASELESNGASLLADYGSYKLFETDLATAQTLHDANRGEIRDESNLILLNAGIIDTAREEVQALRRNAGKASGKTTGMRLVQFVGPVKPEWHDALSRTGVRIVTYIPNNAYLVYADGTALANLREWAANSDFVQWDGEYTADHRVDPSFDQVRQLKAQANVGKLQNSRLNSALADFDQVILQLVSDPNTNQNTINSLKQQLGAQAIVRNTTEYGYVNIVAKLPTGVAPEEAAKNLAARPDVVSIQPYKTPIKMDERQNMIIAANLTGNAPNTGDWLAYLAANGFTQAQFTASNFLVNVTDSGVDNATTNPNHFGLHLSGDLTLGSRVLYNRLLGTPNAGSTLQGCDGHGTLNSHIVAGFVPTGTVGGVNYGAFPHADASGFRYGMGVAPFVKVGSSVIFDPDTFTSPDYEDLESQAYNSGARISTNSWGASVGGAYNSDSQRYDALVRDAQPSGSTFSVAGNQENVILFAAGNNGSGANTVGSPGTGKNVITAGASENVQAFGAADQCGVTDAQADSANDIIGFSSRGPCDDGRIKPDLVAPGTHVSGGVFQSSAVQTGNGAAGACFNASGVCAGPGVNNFFPVGQQFYTASSGTSHSTPAIAGAAALVRQRFINGGLTPPSPAMTKALLMNSARYLTGVGANDNLFSNNQGMGEVNLTQFFDTQLGTVGTTHSIVRDQIGAEMFTASGQTRTFTGTVSNNAKPFRVVLAWTDVPGATSGNAFVNNLDLEVTVGGNTYLGNVFTGANSATGGTADTRNNTESVFIPAGVSGNFVVTVKGTNIAGDGVPNVGGALDQDFALVVYNADQVATPVIGATGSALTAESCTPVNGVLDPNESVTVNLSLQNVGTLNTTNLVATLQATGGVTSPGAAQNYGVLAAGGAAVSRNFTFTVNPAQICGSVVTATLQLQDGATNLGTVTYNFQTGVLNTIFSENFDGVSTPALPAGWTTSFTNGDGDCTAGGALCALGSNWTTVNTTPDTAPNAAFHNDPSCVSDNLLISPTIAISSASAQLSFRNNFNTESTFDGGVLEIKIGAGAFTDIVTAGGSFVAGGYTGVINSGATDFFNPLRGRQAWTGNSSGYITTTVNLPASAAGQNIQLRWRLGSDCSVSGTGWRVDTVRITDGYTCSTTCSVPACTITCPANITVPNTTGACSAVVTYPAPTTSGACSTIICSPASGTNFPVGTTTVTCADSGNFAPDNGNAFAPNGNGASCSFTVTVQDTQAPTIGACPANITVNGSGPTAVTFATPTATDNCPGATVACVPASGSSFAVGTTTVTCTASDASPNSPNTTCTFTVTVVTCTITCPANQVAWTSGTSAPVTYPAPTTTGSCGTVTCTPASGSSFNVGTTTVTCT
ncbi:MAG TPA: S8 family serine peptidase, partial [Blastocatellia bacterium]|nr:S8 family serine peptidase [Blastocatellia bacterium]